MTTECKCPVGLPDGAVEELIALSIAVTGESPCPIHDGSDGQPQ